MIQDLLIFEVKSFICLLKNARVMRSGAELDNIFCDLFVNIHEQMLISIKLEKLDASELTKLNVTT